MEIIWKVTIPSTNSSKCADIKNQHSVNYYNIFREVGKKLDGGFFLQESREWAAWLPDR